METYRFPERDVLLQLAGMVWPEPGQKQLLDRLLYYAGREIAAEGLPAHLSLAIESYCEGRSAGLRLACYATMAPLIRVMVADQASRNLALNEYVSMLDRLNKLEH